MLQGGVRIIGGQWRSRRLRFPAHLNIRPTPDRIRETLFNWLSPTIAGSYCLDLFAGSGALGCEALSRGAAWVGFVESSYEAAYTLRQQIYQFKATDRAFVYHQSYHRTNKRQLISNMTHEKLIDCVFLDPPFREGMLEVSLEWLSTQSFLSPDVYLYMEYERHLALSDKYTTAWQPVKQQSAGQITYGLWIKSKGDCPNTD
jgi:16S rRNA (guanine966-N2)-methyltransferase